MLRSPIHLPRQPHAIVLAGALLLAALPARAALFTPTQTADDDGACDADCSLREAILAANANPGADAAKRQRLHPFVANGLHRRFDERPLEVAVMIGALLHRP